MSFNHKSVLAGLAALALAGTAATALAQQTDEVIVTIKRIQALDKVDVIGKADFYAKVTIAGETQATPVAKQSDFDKPNWKISKRVPRGTHDIKLQLLDKDPGKPDDVIDINRVDKKRDLDFTIDTRNCRIGGLTGGYSCGDNIKRAGAERKKAEITFSVDVKK